MRGERERLLRDLEPRFRAEASRRFSRAYFKRHSRFVLPPPHDQLRDFYDWFLFWTNFPHPDNATQSFFVSNAQALFVIECKYVQRRQTSHRQAGSTTLRYG